MTTSKTFGPFKNLPEDMAHIALEGDLVLGKDKEGNWHDQKGNACKVTFAADGTITVVLDDKTGDDTVKSYERSKNK